MIRANHRCETPGCGRTRFLEVHHRRPRSQGGGNETANLQVLCSACHQVVHRRERTQPASPSRHDNLAIRTNFNKVEGATPGGEIGPVE
ncbi:HNH endonuclease [bacterium]|nr:HNH endonuclease [bacterium]